MSYDRYQYRVVCEDQNHYRFVLAFLKIKGANDRRVIQYGGYAVGDGKKHVKKTLEEVKREFSRVQAGAKTVYIVVRDADMQPYDEVYKELNLNEDNIFLVIPKRNIETWLFFLSNSNDTNCTDEEKDRKKRGADYNSSECAEECSKIINNFHTHIPQNIPDSLKITIQKLKERLKKGEI